MRGRAGVVVLWMIALAGAVGAGVFLWFALQDWAALQTAYSRFESLVASDADMRALFVAEAKQNVHRMNLFAEGVWALLSVIVAAIGLHGLCGKEGRKRT